MAQYDGAIRINTNISTKDAKVQLSALQHTIVKTADEIVSLRSRMDAMRDVKTPTEAYEEMEKQLLNALNTLEELEEKQRSFPKEFSQMSADELAEQAKSAWEAFNRTTEELGQMDVKLSELENRMKVLRKEDGDPNGILPDVENEYNTLMSYYKELQDENSETLKQISMINDSVKISEKIKNAKESVEQLDDKLKELEDTGKGFKLGTDTEEYKNLAKQLQNEQKALAKMNLQYAGLGGIELLAKAKDSFKKLVDIAKRAFTKVDKSAKKSTGSISSFSTRLKGLALSALVFNQISKAFNAMFSGMKEGVGNLYKEVGGFKSAVDGLKASSLTLKNSFAAAFRPLVEIAIPYIQKAIEYMTMLADSFGQFMAAVTGQKTYTKAIKQTTAALEDAKEAEEGYLSPLDEVNKYQDKGSSTASGATGTMFEEDSVGSGFSEMAKVLSQLFQPLKTAWESQGQFVMDSWKYALEEVGLLAQSVGEDFLAVWNQPETISVLENILIIVGDIGLVVGNLAARFREAWEANNTGLQILENIRNISGTIVEHIRNAADATVEWSETLDFSPMLESINSLLEALQPFADNIGAGLEWFYTNVLLPIAGWAIQDAVPTFLDLLAAAIGAVNEVVEALKPLGVWLWDEFLQPLGQWAGDTIIAAMQTVTDLLTEFGNWISENQELVENFVIIIGSFFAAWVVVDLAGVIFGIVVALTTFVATGGLATAVASALGTAIAFLTSPITIAIAAIGAIIAIGVLLYKNWDVIKEKAGQLRDWIVDKWEALKQKTADIWGGIKDKISNIWTGIKTAASVAANAIKNGVLGAWNALKTGTSTVWNAIKNVIRTPINALLGFVEKMANGVINAINVMVSALNGIHFDIPDWIPGIGGKSFGFNLGYLNNISIPRLATGAVIPANREFLAVLGDQKHGTNIEAPLDTIKQALREEALSLGLIGRGNESGNLTLKVYLEDSQLINPKKIFEAVITEGKVQQMSTGKNRLLLEN